MNEINFQQIFITDLMGVIMLIALSIANHWRLHDKSDENRSLTAMIIVTFISCCVESLVFIVDGKPGMLYRIILYAGNTWLFLTNLILVPCWIEFVREHMNLPKSTAHTLAIYVINYTGLALLLINIFTPVVFSVDAGNVYHREPFYLFFLITMPLMLIYSIGMYFYAKIKGGILQFFRVWVFVIPVIIGALIQSADYGVSTLWPFTAIGISALLCSLQNEIIFRDQLTGIFNRFYMDNLKNRLGAKDSGDYIFMMIDLNGFKSINDTYGHAAGDEALRITANLLRKTVGSLGVVMRYAGDEFVVILNTKSQAIGDQCVENIRAAFRDFNRSKETLYDITASIGCCVMNLKTHSGDELINKADRLMYEDKKVFYQKTGNDRRHR